MQLLSLYYFRELTVDLNITKTANRLFLSQQTLSSHILRMEKEYGVALFQRKPIFTLTAAGRYMLRFANRTLEEEKELKNIFSDVTHQECGTIRFGSNSVLANFAFPKIMPVFSQLYPKVRVQVTDDLSSHLEHQILNGQLDLALVSKTKANPFLEEDFNLSYQIYMCIKEDLLDKYYGSQKESLKKQAQHGVHIDDFPKLPLLLLTPPNVLGNNLLYCCQEAHFSPNIYMTTPYSGLTPLICTNTLAAVFLSHTCIASDGGGLSSDVNIFPLVHKNNTPVSQTMALIHRKNQYLPVYTKTFIKMLHKAFLALGKKQVTHLVK